jgi:hypothetical protein
MDLAPPTPLAGVLLPPVAKSLPQRGAPTCRFLSEAAAVTVRAQDVLAIIVAEVFQNFHDHFDAGLQVPRSRDGGLCLGIIQRIGHPCMSLLRRGTLEPRRGACP